MGSNMRPRYIQFRDIHDHDISGLHCIIHLVCPIHDSGNGPWSSLNICILTQLRVFAFWSFLRPFFYPRPVLAFGYCRCLRVCVCPCVRQSRVCPCNYNSSTFYMVPTRSLFPGKVLSLKHGCPGPGKVLTFEYLRLKSGKSPCFQSLCQNSNDKHHLALVVFFPSGDNDVKLFGNPSDPLTNHRCRVV